MKPLSRKRGKGRGSFFISTGFCLFFYFFGLKKMILWMIGWNESKPAFYRYSQGDVGKK